ncbi:hypothetical protein J437_LFUL008567 [Ladona fulva]|uniref:Uncharacterized protein n=1 Tax=Ladona fulva TaxID=123851 RepID=A0A8K0K563_LADFU|nr:hypothetical protein J437_LFUL008567 [Ladona fulva]
MAVTRDCHQTHLISEIIPLLKTTELPKAARFVSWCVYVLNLPRFLISDMYQRKVEWLCDLFNKNVFQRECKFDLRLQKTLEIYTEAMPQQGVRKMFLMLIKELPQGVAWVFVPSHLNPADCPILDAWPTIQPTRTLEQKGRAFPCSSTWICVLACDGGFSQGALCVSHSRTKAILIVDIVFVDIWGIVHHKFALPGTTVNSAFYVGVLKILKKKRVVCIRSTIKGTWRLYHDNTPSHTAFLVRD